MGSQSELPEVHPPDLSTHLILVSWAGKLQKLQTLNRLVMHSLTWVLSCMVSSPPHAPMLCPTPLYPNHSELPKPARLYLGTYWNALPSHICVSHTYFYSQTLFRHLISGYFTQASCTQRICFNVSLPCWAGAPQGLKSELGM